MDIQKLGELAGKRINNGNDILQLLVPLKPNKRYYYLAGKKSPRGDILGLSNDGKGLVVNFDAIDVLAFCVVNGAKINVVFRKN